MSGRRNGRGSGRGRGRGARRGSGRGKRDHHRNAPKNTETTGTGTRSAVVAHAKPYHTKIHQKTSQIAGAGVPLPESTRLALHQQLSEFKESSDESLPLPGLSREERAWVHTLCRDLNLQSKSHGKGTDRTLVVTRIVGKRSVQRLRIRNMSLLEATVRAIPSTDTASFGRIHRGKDRSKKSDHSDRTGESVRHMWPPTRSADSTAVSPKTLRVPKDIVPRQAALPSRKCRSEILELINANQVLILTGETGCGKSTQIPQFCLEHAADRGLDCRIVCTQPRRLAATSIAHRVSQETGTQLGKLVGYNVRLDSNMSPETHLLYVTAGIFLKMIVGNPNIDGITHVFVDEVHERSQDTDFSLILLKSVLATRPQLRVVLMSATMHTETFVKYFPDAAHYHVTGTAHTVERFYLGDVLRITRETPARNAPPNAYSAMLDPVLHSAWHAPTAATAADVLARAMEDAERLLGTGGGMGKYADLLSAAHTTTGVTALMVAAAKGLLTVCQQLLAKNADVGCLAANGWSAAQFARHFRHPEVADYLNSVQHASLCKTYHDHFDDSKDVDTALVAQLVQHICRVTDPGAILVFVPGYDEILRVVSALAEYGIRSGTGSYTVLPLHSTCTPKEQRAVFKRMPPNCRKIVVSTNIAESSITIEDVVYVVDTAKHKEMSYDTGTGVHTLLPTWVPRSSLRQRAGRAGRTQPGVCWHFVSADRLDHLEQQQAPEMLRVPLYNVCLVTSVLCPASNVSIKEFLLKAPSPPTGKSIDHALDVLRKIGALDSTDRITHLGRLLSHISLDPQMARMVFVGACLGCLSSAVIIAATSGGRDPFHLPMNPQLKARAQERHRSLGLGSGGWAQLLLRAFSRWQMAPNRRAFADQHFLRHEVLCTIEHAADQIEQQLQTVGVVGPARRHKTPCIFTAAEANRHASSDEILECCLVAGMYPNIAMPVPGTKSALETYGGVRAVVGKSGSRGSTRSWMVFEKVAKSGGSNFGKVNATLQAATAVHPLAVLLFAGVGETDCEYNDDNDVSHDGPGDGSEFLGIDFDLHDDFDLETLEAGHADALLRTPGTTALGVANVTITIDHWARLELDEAGAGLAIQIREYWQDTVLSCAGFAMGHQATKSGSISSLKRSLIEFTGNLLAFLHASK
eukprot:m.790541 g.790541  ORF g.790541 m.790541 type:complete len:1146 (+) comp23326_c0_seq37:58-3495(+)